MLAKLLTSLFFFTTILAHLPAFADSTAAVSRGEENPIGDGSIEARIENVSERFLGRPYILDPLGEGPGGEISRLPLSREDGFNCTTYVETVLAKSLSSQEAADFDCMMLSIRYKQKPANHTPPSYWDRNHLADSDWTVHEEQLGILRDITSDVAGEHTQTVTIRDIDRTGQLKRLVKVETLKRPDLDAIENPTERLLAKEAVIEHFDARLPRVRKSNLGVKVIPIDDLIAEAKYLQKIPSGTVFNIVRAVPLHSPEGRVDTLVSHQGFLIRDKAGHLLLRSASVFVGDDQKEGVKDVPLTEYFRKVREKSNPPIAGINILEPQARPAGLCTEYNTASQ